MLRTLFIAVLIYATTVTSVAQQAGTARDPQRSIAPKSTSEWPDPAPSAKLPQSNLDIVTAGQPKLRQHCRVHEITADAILCSAKRHGPNTIYERDQILAIIASPAFVNFLNFASAVAIVGGTLAVSFFVPFAWSLTLRIIAGVLLYPCWGGAGEVSDGLDSLGYHDHIHDILLYQRADTPLTVTLR